MAISNKCINANKAFPMKFRRSDNVGVSVSDLKKRYQSILLAHCAADRTVSTQSLATFSFYKKENRNK